MDLRQDNNQASQASIVAILNTYAEFSKVSALVNNDTKTIFASSFNRNEPRFLAIRDFLIPNYKSDINNFKYAGDEIKLLGNNIALKIDESGNNNGEGYLSISLKERFDKVQKKQADSLRPHTSPMFLPDQWHQRHI